MNGASKPCLPLVLADVSASLRRVLAQEGVPTVESVDDPAAGRFVLYDSHCMRRPTIDADQIAIDVEAVRRATGCDAFAQLDDTSAVRTVWRVGPWEAEEETAAVERGPLRRLVVEALQGIVEARGGLWMRIRPTPHPYQTYFSFRFDHDEFVDRDFHAVMDAVAGRESMTTHFVCAATHEPHAAALRRLEDCDVGAHGYRHHTYTTVDENAANIARGIESLRALGLAPRGFAAPFGRQGPAVDRAAAACGVTHTSEFAAAYDDWPYFTESGLVQIPIHPVCLGIVLEAAARAMPGDAAAQDRAADDTAQYFAAAARTMHAAAAPMMFYGHPDRRLGRYPHVLHNLLKVVEDLPGVWKTNYSELQRWWRARAAIRLTVRECDDGYELRADGLPATFQCAVEWIAGESSTVVALKRPAVRIRRGSQNWAPLPSGVIPRPVGRAPARGLRDRLRRAIDWEYVTPVDEIDATRWRGRLKRTLRRWKERAA